jgi:hypothetical protein
VGLGQLSESQSLQPADEKIISGEIKGVGGTQGVGIGSGGIVTRGKVRRSLGESVLAAAE